MLNIIEKQYNWAYGLTDRATTTHLILHHSGGSSATAQAIHDYHLSKGWAGIAYHYLVRKDGTITRGRPENKKGGHTSGMNNCSIGICFEGNFIEETMPDIQIKAGMALVADIKARYPGIIVGRHCDYNATGCPGDNFPFKTISEVKEFDGTAENSDEPSAWAKEAWEWAIANGLTDGTRPQEPMTREQVATILYRYDKMKGE